MTKSEFIERLCKALEISGSAELIEKNRAYYNEYIDGETAKGRSEAEVLAELGEPELIANSILEANGFRNRVVDDSVKTYNAYDTPDGDPTTFAQGREYTGKGGDESEDPGSFGAGGRTSGNSSSGHSPKTGLIIFLIIGALLIIGVIALLIAVIGGVFAILGPILIPILIVWVIYKIIRLIIGR